MYPGCLVSGKGKWKSKHIGPKEDFTASSSISEVKYKHICAGTVEITDTFNLDVFFFNLKEVDIGLAADVGTLQRLPKVIGSRR